MLSICARCIIFCQRDECLRLNTNCLKLNCRISRSLEIIGNAHMQYRVRALYVVVAAKLGHENVGNLTLG